jgi:hypothetical protein
MFVPVGVSDKTAGSDSYDSAVSELKRLAVEVRNIASSFKSQDELINSDVRKTALERLRKFEKEYPCWQVWSLAANVAYRLCDPEFAIVCADRALGIAPGLDDAMNSKVGSLFMLGKRSEARAIIRNALTGDNLTQDLLSAEHILIDFDPEYPEDLRHIEAFCRKNQNCQNTINELLQHSIIAGEWIRAQEATSRFRFRFGLTSVSIDYLVKTATPIGGLSHFMEDLIETNPPGPTNPLGTTDATALSYFACKFDRLREIPLVDTTRKQRVGQRLFHALAYATEESWNDFHEMIRQCISISQEPPQSIDSISTIAGSFPKEFVSWLQSLDYLDPNRLEELDAEGVLDKFQTLVAGETIVQDEKLRYVAWSNNVSSELEYLRLRATLSLLSRKGLSKQAGAQYAQTEQQVIQLIEELAKPKPGYMGLLGGAVKFKRAQELRGSLTKDSPLPGVSKTSMRAIDGDLILNLTRSISHSSVCDAMTPKARRFCIQLLKMYSGSKTDDYKLFRSLILLLRAEKKNKEADDALKEAVSRWKWFKP